MEKQYRIANAKVLFLSMFVMALIICGLVYVANYISYTVNQTYFLIFGLSFLTLLMGYINVKFSKILTFSTEKDGVLVKNEHKNIKVESQKVIDYNFFMLTNKTLGYIFRIDTETKRYTFWIVWLDLKKITEEEHDQIKELKEKISVVFKGKKKKKGADFFCIFLSWIPFLLLAAALLILIFGAIYIINL